MQIPHDLGAMINDEDSQVIITVGDRNIVSEAVRETVKQAREKLQALERLASSRAGTLVAGRIPGGALVAREITALKQYADKFETLDKVGAQDKGWEVTGWLNEDPKFDHGASWDSPQSMGLSDINDAVNMVTSLSNKLNLTAIPQFRLQSVAGSALEWNGSDHFRISLPLIFIALGPDVDVRVNLRKLLSATFPVIEGDNEFINLVEAPLGYSRGRRNPESGGMSLRIGKWFFLSSIMVCSNVTYRISKEIIGSGLPLYAEARVDLISSKIMSAREMRNAFLNT